MTKVEILEAAAVCVNGQRQQDYGTPEDNFSLIAKLWGVYTGHGYTPVDVAMMMALLKTARIKTGCGTEDSFVDLAGYAACAGEIATQPKECVTEWAEDYSSCSNCEKKGGLYQ